MTFWCSCGLLCVLRGLLEWWQQPGVSWECQGGSAHNFGTAHIPAEELVVVVVGAGDDSQVCSEGEV